VIYKDMTPVAPEFLSNQKETKVANSFPDWSEHTSYSLAFFACLAEHIISCTYSDCGFRI
jgi:hypothetical protein